jgi:hydroxypyruvate reductase
LSCELLDIYRKVLKNLAPDDLVRRYLRARNDLPGQLDVLAVGKAAVPMACAASQELGERVRRGFLLTKYEHLDDSSQELLQDRFELRESAHPVPDAAGLKATTEILNWVGSGSGHLLVLMSGGASALLVAPQEPLELEDLIEINTSLLKSGLPIEKMNVLRKHLSRVKGGQLAARCTGYDGVEQLLMVDICAPDLKEEEVLSLVGSGCFVADPFTVEEAGEVLRQLSLPTALIERAEKALHETPKEVRGASTILASHRSLLKEAEAVIGEPLEHPDWRPEVTGEVRALSTRFARIGRELKAQGRRGIFVAAGEPTVEIEVENPGRGGRCQELALLFAREIAGFEGLRLLAGSSDGTDGPTGDAGALVDGATWPALRDLMGEDELERVVREHDSGSALARLDGALLRTGPTGQNVNDLYLLEIS